MLKSTISYWVGIIIAIIGIIFIIVKDALKDDNPDKKILHYIGGGMIIIGLLVAFFLGFLYFARRNE